MITLKTPEEIDLMREPCKIVKDVLDLLGSRIRVGMSTKELDEIAYKYITDCGGYPSSLGYCGFPASICASVDGVVVHGIPSKDIILKEGQIVSLDVTVEYKGFNGDAARTFAVGKISPEKQRLIKVTEECFFKAVEGLCAGTPLGNVGYKIQSHAEANGYSVVREMVGHGIGREMHEDPSVPNYGKKGTGIRLREGMTICIEPMINMGKKEVLFLSDGWSVVTKDGSPSAHYENTVAITEDGAQILTL